MTGLFVDSQISSQGSEGDNDTHRGTYLASFSACTTQVAHLADVFSAITTLNPQALMIIKPSGIVVYSEYNHVSNVQLNVDPSLFSLFSFLVRDANDVVILSQEDLDVPTELRLGVDVSLISDAFASVAASSPSTKLKNPNNPANNHSDPVTCYFTYNGEGHPLVIEFEDNLMSEKIEFLTFYTDFAYPYDSLGDSEHEELVINHNQIQSELILKSDVFSNLLADLHQINTVELYIYLSNEARGLGKSKNSKIRFTDSQLNFISRGPIGHLKLIYPSERTILEKLVLYGKDPTKKYNMVPVNTSLISCYNFANFIKIFRAVKLSSKCKILKDLNGVLSIQLLCKNNILPTYAGTLITFHHLEVSSYLDEDFQKDQVETARNFNSIFDDENYEYATDANAKEIAIEEYQELDMEAEKTRLTYASFMNQPNSNSNGGKMADNNRGQEGLQKKRKREDKLDDNGKGIHTVGGAVEVPLFL
ncbi:uncharacterized protein CANTADRAFT_55046 [Suhomyces tanzawaensis NRRL Y-17324]|uniref:DNA damage checkpoint control protein RAD17 n=1 Tax=Suhomyces tanzawaensis NRRL Y-17324 TaxID=984487 RepID=A0A1E4SDZ2_9ASCO|nr:uncharacterized protein CANTADRAFT_55046 [Suhomyces tanzawaensis NRRL Y-17324]ODV77725.1 hypothetical protein CANTADRAFT_55046 [Suhomyces tanzawaensis NRRL Y-17324]